MSTVIIPANVAPITKLCADNDLIRFAATVGVKVETTEKGYRLIATDGRRLAIVEGSNEAAGKIGDVGELRIGEPADSAVIPKGPFHRAFDRVTEFGGVDEDGDPMFEVVNPSHVSVSVGEKASSMAFRDAGAAFVKIEAENASGRSQDIEKVIPKSAPVASIRLDASMLKDLLTLAESLQNGSGGTLFEIYAAKGTTGPMMMLRTANDEGQKMLGLLTGLVEAQ